MNKNAIIPKPFIYDNSTMKIDKNALNVGNPFYLTSNMEYGSLEITKDEVLDVWYPKTNKFTEKNKNTLYKNNGLNTNIEKNKVHDLLDIYF